MKNVSLNFLLQSGNATRNAIKRKATESVKSLFEDNSDDGDDFVPSDEDMITIPESEVKAKDKTIKVLQKQLQEVIGKDKPNAQLEPGGRVKSIIMSVFKVQSFEKNQAKRDQNLIT